jgi:hypothetical protein
VEQGIPNPSALEMHYSFNGIRCPSPMFPLIDRQPAVYEIPQFQPQTT